VRGLEGLAQVPERFADIRRHTRGLLAPQRVGSCQFCIEGTSHRIITMPIMPMQLMHCRWPASRFPLASRNVVLIALCTAVGEMMLVLIAMRTDASSNLQVGHASDETSCACRSVAARRTCWLPGLFFSEVRSTAVLTSSQPLFPALHVVSRYGIYIYIIIIIYIYGMVDAQSDLCCGFKVSPYSVGNYGSCKSGKFKTQFFHRNQPPRMPRRPAH